MIINVNKLFTTLIENNFEHGIIMIHFYSSSSAPIDQLFEEKNFEELSVDKYRPLITDPKVEARVEQILHQYEYEKYTTLRVPSTITVEQMKDLLQLKEENDVNKWIQYLFKREGVRRSSIRKQKRHSEEYWAKKHEEYSKTDAPRTGIWDNKGNLDYGLWHNTLFSKILRNAVKRL